MSAVTNRWARETLVVQTPAARTYSESLAIAGPSASVSKGMPERPTPRPLVESIGFAHNGFHVDDGKVRPVGIADRIAEPRSSVAEAYTADIPGEHV